jgi:hypothetical protein
MEIGRYFSDCVVLARSLAILELARRYLMEPDGLRHGEVSTVSASSIGMVDPFAAGFSRRDNKNNEGNPQ